MHTNDPELTALAFTVAGARLAVRVPHVREVLPSLALQTVPEMPPLIRGFLALGDEMIPILRLEQLLRLEAASDTSWSKDELSNQIVLIRTGDGSLGWTSRGDSTVLRFSHDELVRLPVGHSLNDCAEFVIARTPPEPSIVLLEPRRLLLEKERACVEELRARAVERLSELSSKH